MIVLGDESGYTVGEASRPNWRRWRRCGNRARPAGFNLIAVPNEAEMKNDFEIDSRG